MKARVIVFAIGLALLAGIWLRWPSDERRIRALVGEIAGTFDGRDPGSELERVARLAPLARALAPDVVVDGLSPDDPVAVTGRDAVLGAAAGALRLVPDLTIQVEHVAVKVAPGSAEASAIAALIVSSTRGEAGEWRDIREVQLELSRREDQWLVTRVTPVQALQR